MKKFALLLFCLSPQSIHANEPLLGIFNSDFCRSALEHIVELRGASYREDAVQLGISQPHEIEEYIHRRSRGRYLANIELENALLETGLFHFLDETVSSDSYLNTSVNRRSELWKALAKRFGNDWFEGEVRGREAFALFVSVFEAKPPATLAEVEEYKKIALARAALALYRSRISSRFVNLPLQTNLYGLSPDLLKGIYQSQFMRLTEVEAIWNAIFLEPMFSNEIPDEVGFKALIVLMSSPKVPIIIKAEVSKEMNFTKKYQFPMHPAFKLFLTTSIAYFL